MQADFFFDVDIDSQRFRFDVDKSVLKLHNHGALNLPSRVILGMQADFFFSGLMLTNLRSFLMDSGDPTLREVA